MRIGNITQSTLDAALAAVNRNYGGNIRYRDGHGAPDDVRLTVAETGGPGTKLNNELTGRIAAACWHVHGVLFEEVRKLAPDAVIRTAGYVIRNGDDHWPGAHTREPSRCLCKFERDGFTDRGQWRGQLTTPEAIRANIGERGTG